MIPVTRYISNVSMLAIVSTDFRFNTTFIFILCKQVLIRIFKAYKTINIIGIAAKKFSLYPRPTPIVFQISQ